MATTLITILLLAGFPTPAGPAPAAGRAPVPATSPLPTLRLQFTDSAWRELFSGHDADDGKTYVAAEFTDERGESARTKVALRGFSSWHHGLTKPSLRLKPSVRRPHQPEHLELQRPEDLLAIGNAIPDALAQTLGLLQAGNEPVRLFLGDRFAGVYLRSLRPGPDLARAGGRPTGTFCKGDNLGDRRGLDLWASAASWRLIGDDTGRAAACLDDLLATLRQPPSAARCERLWQLLDFEATARVAALATVVGSIHADRSHNQLLFFTPTLGRCEPVLWDANGFGIHADPDVPVDIARHPLASVCLGDPRFLHRRDQMVAMLLRDGGIGQRITAHAARVATDLRADPEPGRLDVRGDGWNFTIAAEADLARAEAEAQAWFAARERHLLAWLADARVAVARNPSAPGQSVVQVFGNVGITVAREDGALPQGPDGTAATLLLPGRSLTERDRPQHRDERGRGVPAPFPEPTSLSYVLVGEPDELRFANAITGAALTPTAPPPATPTRSAHPWSFRPPVVADVVLGPGPVDLASTVYVPAGARLSVHPGTTIRLAAGVGIVCAGDATLVGTADAPIELIPAGDDPWGALALTGSPRVRIACATLRGGGAMTHGHRLFPGMLTVSDTTAVRIERTHLHAAHGAAMTLSRASATLAACRVGPTFGDGIVVDNGELTAAATRVAFCRGRGLFVGAGARALLDRCELTGNDVDTAVADGGAITDAPAATPR